MTSLKQTLQADLTSAMRAHDHDTVRTVRMILTAIAQAQVSGTSAHELSTADEVAILSTELKRRREAAEAFAAANRPELAEAERAEADVIARYLPQPLTEVEVAELVDAAIAEARAAGRDGGAAMGTVMKALKPATAGRFDGAALAAMVKRGLGLG